jgi:outer membrane biogenesis lipoprotein LolB
MRLMGLPNVELYPEAKVRRTEEAIEIHFVGPERQTGMEVPLKYLGGADAEGAEYRLLAQLQEMGYRVERLT